jgi:xanthine dehydrogenase accessory factor
MLDILDTVETWLNEGRSIALATVVETWGSSPRQAGAKMAVTSDSAMIGSVSGGCVETAVVSEALDSLSDKRPRLLHFGVSDDTAWDVGLACGGKISVFVEPLDLAWWQAAGDALRMDRPMATLIVLDGDATGQKMLVDTETGIVYTSENLEPDLYAAFLQAAQEALSTGNSARTRIADLDVLIDVSNPRPCLIIIGGAHVAMALNMFAKQLGFRVVLIDPRKAFATPERFPDVEMISHQYPDKILPELALNSESYIAILTHDPKIDDPALRVALPSPAPYIGILSSRRTHEKRIERLTAAGIDPQLLTRIRTPIGLDIGAKTPEEVALCIMAEIVAVRNGAIV